MIFDWYRLFNLTEWRAEELPSRTLIIDLEDRGRTEFLISEGNETGILYDDEFLPVNFLEQNPYVKNGYAVYLDANDDVHFGFEVPE